MTPTHPNPLVSQRIAKLLSQAITTFSDEHPHLDEVLRQTYVADALLTLLGDALGTPDAHEMLVYTVEQISRVQQTKTLN